MKAKKISGAILLILLVAGFIVLASSTIVTKEDQYSIVKRFGKIERVIDEAGLSFRTPFIETVDVIPKNIQFYDMPESDVITMDKKTMVADSYVLWKVKDPIKFAQSLNNNVVQAENRIDTTVYNAMKNVISSLSQSDVISGRDGELNTAFMENIGNSMDQYGIELITVETKHLDLPSDNKTAVFERMISERAQIAATYTAEGESEAQKIRNTTDKDVAISISNAEAEAAKIIAEGEAEYMKILSQAYSSKERSEFYTFVRSLDAARAALNGDNKTLILSEDSPLAQIFYNID
ncbi:protease modulator HflC [Lachnospiraceae bacterium MD1]|jgi:membrane protease subunit HflC|uniref:Protein HflC n=1 Tax=Variimorphobacter saccharofermentans TaxID=2755051 RepID=A0A839K0W2_9FIRM|nr:protease modulator HflC [Variimorphobacter saccharofermentans]MBB2183068.1 protease modulator HflC [Variimorphobacter saccharofermentans]